MVRHQFLVPTGTYAQSAYIKLETKFGLTPFSYWVKDGFTYAKQDFESLQSLCGQIRVNVYYDRIIFGNDGHKRFDVIQITDAILNPSKDSPSVEQIIDFLRKDLPKTSLESTLPQS